MSREKEPAYPHTAKVSTSITGQVYPIERTYGGLTIREHFAAMAMQGFASNGRFTAWGDSGACIEEIAASAVSMADALLAELAKVKP